MSLYNLMFGENQKADLLLACLGLTRDDCGRYRDCYIDEGKIVIHTRCGGGNRDDYESVFETLSDHPCYLTDSDDSFDCTYADIYFSFPEEYAEDLKKLEEASPDIKPSEKWQSLLASLKA